MALSELLELLFVAFVVLVGVSQVVIPLWRGKNTFPILRKRARLETDVIEAREDIEDARLESEAVAAARRADTLRRNRSSTTREKA